MKTVIIYDQMDAGLKFFVVEGDYTHLDKVYINHWCETKAEQKKSDKLQNELNKLVYHDEGTIKLEALTEFPTQAVIDGAVVIVAGFLP